MHHSRLCAVLIDCQTSDVDEAARFWGEALGRRHMVAIGYPAWFSLTNRNPSAGSCSSPERTRPRLLTGSPAPAGAGGSHA
jgi:hypothetical protein